MPADELAALLRVVTLIADLDPATAWELDAQLDGLSKATAAFAEGLATYSDRLTKMKLHDSITGAAVTGSENLVETAAAFAAARRSLRTVYAAQFAAAEAQVSHVERRHFWGETPRNAGGGPQASPPPTAPAAEPVAIPAGRPGPAPQPGEQVSAAAAALPRGQVEPGDGSVPDVANLTGLVSGYWHGSDVVPGLGQNKVWLGLVRYTEPGREPTGTYVAVATAAGDRWDPDSETSSIVPALSTQEAGQLADELDDLIALAQSEAAATPPTKLAKLANRLRGLLDDADVTVIGNEGKTEVSAAMLRQLLDAAAPAPATPTRRKVTAKDCDQDNMDNGTIWIEIDASGATPAIAVTSVEGNEQPEDYPEGYTTTKLPLPDASQLAAKLRRFAQEAPKAAAGRAVNQPTQVAPGPDRKNSDPVVDQVRRASATAVPAEPRRVSNTSGKKFEYDPATGAAAVIEPDGWRAAVPPSSPTGIAARLLYWNAEIKDGRGDDATDAGARALLGPLSATELRELADDVGASARGARTKSQLVDSIINTAISSPRNARALRGL